MNDEIKEILDYMKKESNYKHLSFNASKLLLDYITNLQQENEDYKSKVEKAINNCKKSIEAINTKLENNKEPFEVVDGKIIYLNDYQVARLKAIRMKCKELLNILQNGSENNE